VRDFRKWWRMIEDRQGFWGRLIGAWWLTLAGGATLAGAASLPHYEHIFVIIAENKGYDQIIGPTTRAPNINRLAQRYGLASEFYAETHPSEPNYIAMLGGDTFGIRDDDAFYCKADLRDASCLSSGRADYVDHTVTARGLPDQLQDHGLTWKGYMESLPEAGSLVPRWPTIDHPVTDLPSELYAAKHNGFVSFATVQKDPERAGKIVDFAQLDRDLAAGAMPNYAHIVANQCNDMHGLGGANTPSDCLYSNLDGLIARGDRVVDGLVQKIIASSVWRAPANTAIVITFDEDDMDERHSVHQGCCGYEPHSKANFGGGRIPTIVITNHGVRHFVDATPYNHYSLLRTTEAAFGLKEYLGHAADESLGVVTMTPLFALSR
jgi:phospholipase C